MANNFDSPLLHVEIGIKNIYDYRLWLDVFISRTVGVKISSQGMLRRIVIEPDWRWFLF